MTIGDRIKNRRKELGLTQDELGKKLNVTRFAICKVETDKEQNLTIDRVSQFANALGVSASYLMGWDEEIPESDPVLAATMIMDSEYKELYEKYIRLTDEQKRAVSIMIDTMLA